MPIYIFQNNSLDVVEGERLMVGDTQVENIALQNHVYSLKDIKKIYMASDGMQDQFGGAGKKRFMSKRFKKMLFDIHKIPAAIQVEVMEQFLSDWMGEESQVDDITVLGIRLDYSTQKI